MVRKKSKNKKQEGEFFKTIFFDESCQHWSVNKYEFVKKQSLLNAFLHVSVQLFSFSVLVSRKYVFCQYKHTSLKMPSNRLNRCDTHSTHQLSQISIKNSSKPNFNQKSFNSDEDSLLTPTTIFLRSAFLVNVLTSTAMHVFCFPCHATSFWILAK